MRKYKVKEVIALLERIGWYLDRIRGDHRQFVSDRYPGTVTVVGKENETKDSK